MIKLKLTKDKLGAIIQSLNDITEALERERDKITFPLQKMEMKANQVFLLDLRNRLQIKHIQMSMKSQYGKTKLTFSFNEVEAFLLVKYHGYGFNPNAGYQFAIMAEITDPFCQQLT